jgi:hypothetical protein
MEKKIKSLRYIERNINNADTFSSFNSKDFLINNINILEKELEDLKKEMIQKMPPNLEYKLYSNNKKRKDYSIYSGTGGNMYIYWRYLVYKISKNEKNLEDDLDNLRVAIDTNKKLFNEEMEIKNNKIEDGVSTAFFHGPIGIYTMSSIYNLITNNKNNFNENIKKIFSFKKFVFSNNSEDELLYGNAGYLYSLLIINREINLYKNKFYSVLYNNNKEDVIENNYNDIQKDLIDLIWQTVKFLWRVGNFQKNKYKYNFLIFPFPRNNNNNDNEDQSSSNVYLGGAHGVAGNLFLMLKGIKCYNDYYNKNQKDEKEIKIYEDILGEIQASLIQIGLIRFKSGNFPSSYYGDVNEEKDNLVQFCHGAPGFISLYIEAFKHFKNNNFLEIAMDCGKIIKERGILKKGFGVCHGITGNNYFLYTLSKYFEDDNDSKNYIYWFNYFIEFLFLGNDKEILDIVNNFDDRSRKTKGLPDTPYSLMEGIGGRMCFLSEVLANLYNNKNIDFIKFPGYEI